MVSLPAFDPGWSGLEEAPLVFLDLEATGPMAGDRIIEIGALLVEGEEILDRFHAFVDPELPVPAPVQAIHGIGEALLRGASPVAEALAGLFRFLERSQGLCAHHAPADMRFLAYDARRAGLLLPVCPVLDTRIMARRLLGRGCATSLAALCERYGIPMHQKHRALPDARCTHLLFRRLLSEAAASTSTAWSWPRPSCLSEANLGAEALPETWAALEPRSPPVCVEIGYERAGGHFDAIEIRPLAFVQGRRHVYLRACEIRSGLFKFYQLKKIRSVCRGEDQTR